MMTSNAPQSRTTPASATASTAAMKRDVARRRVRMATLGVAAVTIGATSIGAVALAQSTNTGDSSAVVTQQGANGTNVSSGAGQAPVANSGGS